MFNDSDWIGIRHERRAEHRRGWLEHVKRPVVIELGAGTAIPTVRHFSQRMALEHNAALIRINPQNPQLGNLPDVAIEGGALDVLAAIDRCIEHMQ
jgi:hypothetical protein